MIAPPSFFRAAPLLRAVLLPLAVLGAVPTASGASRPVWQALVGAEPPVQAEQPVPAAVAAFRTAWARGDAPALAALLSERALVSLDGDGRVYSREQAAHVLARFFRDRPADGFDAEPPRETGRDAFFVAGRFRSEGDVYVVRAVMSRVGSRAEIRELRVEQGRLE